MSGPFVYTAAIWPPILTALFLLALAAYSWRRRRVPGALPFAVSGVFSALWAASYALQYAATDPLAKTFWLRFGLAWSLPALTAITCFILEYAWPGRWLTRRTLALLAIMPLLFVLLLASRLHPLLIRDYVVSEDLYAQTAPGGWVFFVYAYLLGLLNIGVLVWLFVRSPQQRWLAALLMAGQVISRAFYAQQILSADHFDLPFNAPILIVPYLIYAVALFALRIFDPIVMARQSAIDQLDAGVLVLDRAGRVVGHNPAAAHMLGLSGDQIRERPIGALLPAGAAATIHSAIAAGSSGSHDTSLRERDIQLQTSPLRDWRGLDVGHLLLLHDVTAQNQAQAQLLAQQRVLATLQERERLARELHDSAAQMLSYTSVQAQAIQKHVHDGNLATAEAQLARLAEVASAAHTDVRESILGLKASGEAAPRLLATLGQYLTTYRVNYGIATELRVTGGLSEDDFTPDIAVHLLRVIAEALTNARKHAHAGRVCVDVARADGGARVDGGARITIADDGRGFDSSVAGAPEHYGLAFMRERMAQVGGRLAIDSRPGVGTRVVLDVPLPTPQEVTT